MFTTSSFASEVSFTRTESQNESFHWWQAADKIILFQYETYILNIAHKTIQLCIKIGILSENSFD